jgi:hypothetical protein
MNGLCQRETTPAKDVWPDENETCHARFPLPLREREARWGHDYVPRKNWMIPEKSRPASPLSAYWP